ncbi:UNVERIFIED_CONTAM: hypothetical protein Sradi_6978300 [Sesamum radiatum]|uniref:Uncharacterized protein n=1 Tax=Sesamum radiatum TaxID=300843 RepID=A0AAW2JE59_SESRA
MKGGDTFWHIKNLQKGFGWAFLGRKRDAFSLAFWFSASGTPPSIDSVAAAGGDFSPPPPLPQGGYPDPPLAKTRNKIK